MPPVISASSAFSDFRLQQALRNAEQADQSARALQAQAGAARRNADRAVEGARSIEQQSAQAQQRAGQARLGVATMQTTPQVVEQLSTRLDQAITKSGAAPVEAAAPVPVAETEAVAEPVAVPTVNAEGQTTGTIINVTA